MGNHSPYLALVMLVHVVTKIRGMYSDNEKRYYNVGVLMASHLDSPFDLERCGPAVDLALEEVNEKFLEHHGITLRKVEARYVTVSSI